MQIKHITLELNEDELITIHSALEDTVKNGIERSIAMGWNHEELGDYREEMELLQELTWKFGYQCTINAQKGFFNLKSYTDIKEWAKMVGKLAKKTVDKEKTTTD